MYPTIRSFPLSRVTASGPTSGRRRSACSMRRSSKAYGGKRRIAWIEVLAGQKAFDTGRGVAARRDGGRVPRVPRRHQGPADDAGRRRDPQPERGASPDPRSLRVPAPGALVRRACPRPVQAPGEGRHGDLPREHRRRLRRHRVRSRVARERSKLIDFLDEEFGWEDPARQRHRHQADLGDRHQASGARGHPSTPSPTSRRASRSCTRATS